jgi:hypothetical protein
VSYIATSFELAAVHTIQVCIGHCRHSKGFSIAHCNNSSLQCDWFRSGSCSPSAFNFYDACLCVSYPDINYVTLGPVQGALDADWEVLNQNQWRVRFLSIKFSLAGIQLVNKPIADTVGLWTITYLDDELRILTARSLARNDGGNVYVLKRE